MKKNYAAAVVVALAAATNAFAAEELVFDAASQQGFSQCTQTSIRYDHDDLTMWSYQNYNGLGLYNYSVYSYDDYLTTPDLPLNAGEEYVVYLTPCLYSTLDTEWSVKVLFGQGDDLEKYTMLKALTGATYTYDAEEQAVSFMVPESGNYRVSFEGLSRLYLRTAKICSRGASAVPQAPADFKLTPDADGALSVEVSFTMPSTTLTGQPLAGATSYTLYRGVQAIKKDVAAAPGEKVVYTEKRGEAGNVTYAVVVAAGDQSSEKLSAVTYVGPETPGAPENVKIASTGNVHTVSWEAPVFGTHGASLDPAKLSYTVTRIVDGASIVVASNLTRCSYSEEVFPSGLQALKYSVKAKYAAPGLESPAVESPQVRIGSVAMPFADSFAGGEFSPLWDNECVSAASSKEYFWTAVESLSRPAIQPYDGDGGFAYYNFYLIQKGNRSRLATPPLQYAAGMRPVISFAKFNVASNNKADIVKVQVSVDNGEWIDVPGAEYVPAGSPANQWVVVSTELAAAIPASAKTFRVALLAVSDYGENFAIDDVRVFNLVDKDLAVSAVAVDSEVKAGKNATLSVRVSNNGANEAKAADYSLEVLSDYPGSINFGEMQDIPALGSATYTVEVPFSSLHALEATEYSFNVQVKLNGDQLPDNDKGEAQALQLGYSVCAPATELSGTLGENGAVVLSWVPAKDLEYSAVAIAESFEDPGFKEDSTGPFNGWVTIDIDGASGGTWYSASGSELNLAKDVSTPKDADGRNVLGVTVASNKQQDDWLISPQLNCRESAVLRLDMLLGLKQISSYGNTYKVEILYTTDDSYSMLNPAEAFTKKVAEKSSTSVSDSWVPQDNKMHEVSFDGIPGEARYVAIHFCSKGSYTPAMWVDNVRLVEIDSNPLLGYHIYDVNAGTRLNGDQLISSDATSFTLTASNGGIATMSMDRPVFVSAVYPDGEAEPSNMIDLDNLTTGIESIKADAEGDVRYFNLQGIEVNASALTPGIYIRHQGASAVKIRLR
ncbi:MAG: choice-of-anchor J domain-containing protein [Muribaculaceae bacterium]|nr:choice-of-anchor J domain-containing protein [Muribaculaceae bacterium]